MANWLQKITSAVVAPTKNRNLPTLRPGQMPSTIRSPGDTSKPPELSNASLIYGIASSALFVIALYFLITGRWFTALLIGMCAACFLGFAVQFLRR